MLSNHLISWHPLLLLCSNFPSIRVFSNELAPPSGGQNIRASALASVLPMNIQGWFPLGLTGLISWQSKGLSRVFSGTIDGKHQFFAAQPSLWSNSYICTLTSSLRAPVLSTHQLNSCPRAFTPAAPCTWKSRSQLRGLLLRKTLAISTPSLSFSILPFCSIFSIKPFPSHRHMASLLGHCLPSNQKISAEWSFPCWIHSPQISA